MMQSIENSLSIRESRFSSMFDKWSLTKLHSLMGMYTPTLADKSDLYFSVMLYISKAMGFQYTPHEELFLLRIKNNKNNLTNITPNGGVVPKKEYQLEYNMVLRSWSKLVKSMVQGDPSLLSRFRITPNIRIKFGEEIEENLDRPLTTSHPHSDAWVEGPWGMNCYIPLLGDVKNNNLKFWKPKKFKDEFVEATGNYEEMQWVLDYYEPAPELIPEKGKVHISDYALIHATDRKEGCGTRVSIDTTVFVGDYPVHSDRESEYLPDVKIIGEDYVVSTDRSVHDHLIDKRSTFSHYTTGALKLHEC